MHLSENDAVLISVCEPLNHIHQDTESARLIAVCKRSITLNKFGKQVRGCSVHVFLAIRGTAISELQFLVLSKEKTAKCPREKLIQPTNWLKNCTKLNVHYIDNSNIRKSHLNGSRLHLNRNGDRILGKNLCSYLKLMSQNTFNSGEINVK